MRRISIMIIAFIGVASVLWAPNANAGFNIGAGVHYLHALGDIDTNDPDLSKDSFGIVGSAQFAGPMLKLEGNVEYIFDYLGTDEALWQPSIYALLGNFIYGGAGMGWGNFDSQWTDPWYALRAGVNLPLGLDLYATYLFWSDDDLKNLTGDDLDSITFSAIMRFGL